MNKELFVSSTPHETKVGMVEDDQLAEIYLERENEYTLAGSIYKGRVTRVLPGMQSAFVDIGLERDAFLYVSDFLDLEEHDEDLTDSVPAGRTVQDMRPQPVPSQSQAEPAEMQPANGSPEAESEDESGESERPAEAQANHRNGAEGNGNDSQGRERGSWRGRRRRRGGRRDGRDGRERGFDRSPREDAPAASESRTQSYGPPAGYVPIVLPGESISKYQRMAHQAAPGELNQPEPVSSSAGEATTPLAATFPEDEPLFAAPEQREAVEPTEQSGAVSEVSHSQYEDAHDQREETEAASTSVNWNQEYRQPEAVAAQEHSDPVEAREVAGISEEEISEDITEEISISPREAAESNSVHESRSHENPVFAAPGTMEEETIEEEETDTARYEDSSDDSYDEFEEETQAVGQSGPRTPEPLISDVRETVEEIHFTSLAESGELPHDEQAAAEDSDDLDLEEAQAEAEALLDAEARANGTVDARAEVRAPAGTAGYTQRTPRPAFDRRSPRGRRGGRRFRRRESQPVPQISDLLKEGQEILVQIAKEPIGKKGARITSHIALPGRFLVYMPTVNHTGVSRKIASEEERQRLKRIVMSERENGHGGFIVRTAAQNAAEDELRADIRFLKGLWNDIKNRAEGSKPPALIYHDLNVVERVLRDQVTSDFSAIWVDTEAEYERILRFFNRFQPGMVKRVKLYTKETPLFEQFGLSEEMNKALKSKVWLKSGGYIVINQTEALVAIDINTGKYVGKTARLEDTIVKTNVDAIKEIVRQIRLRDLGGIIIIDFIDMDERRNRQRVMQALEEELRHDRAPSKVLQFNDFGLVAITRKRVKQSLERTIGTPCPYCQSTGYVKSVTTICNEIYVEMRKIAKHLEHEDVMLRVHPDVAKELKSNNARLLNEMEEMTKRTIIVKSDPALHQEQFDIN